MGKKLSERMRGVLEVVRRHGQMSGAVGKLTLASWVDETAALEAEVERNRVDIAGFLGERTNLRAERDRTEARNDIMGLMLVEQHEPEQDGDHECPWFLDQYDGRGRVEFETWDDMLRDVARQHGLTRQLAAIAERCGRCNQEIDPAVCHCGELIDKHGYGAGHSPIPMGCDCGRNKG